MDAYQIVTDKIVALMEKGIIPWRRPFVGTKTCGWSRSTGKAYSFVNQILLAGDCEDCMTIDDILAKSRGEWLTYKQATELGGHVKKGEKGRQVLFFKWLEKENSNGETESVPCLRFYTVFRVDQCEGIEQKYYTDLENDIEVDYDAEQVISDYLTRTGVTFIQRASNQAYYMPARDEIVVPNLSQFESTAEYYSTVFHEMTHSTGHESRLNRVRGIAAMDRENYSVEELVAEIGAASICSTLHLDTDSSITNSAAYIQGWMKAIKDNKRMFVIAASQAEKAIRMILNIQQGNGVE